ncbi:MAG: hypothetical protein WCC63_01150 [Candidatus Bathyarchaeia archaeon]
MKKQTAPVEKFCGNCHQHNTYRYPDQIFCMLHFLEQKNPIYSTLDVCEKWKLDNQECFCLQEAFKKRQGKP